MAEISSEIQKLDPSAMVSLFILDCTSVGGLVLYFTQTAFTDTPISYGGNVYQPIDIAFEDFETSVVGAMPTPSLRLSNTDGMIQSIINTYGDLNGCQLARLRTFVRFLDGQPDADPSACFGPDLYQVDRKASDTPTEVVWELSASVDQEGKKLPGRVLVRDVCLWRYRYWNGSSFDYAKAQCPYTGSNYFDANDQPVATAAQDAPSRSKTCCKLRFGAGQVLPFGGFPGMGRSL